MGLGRIAGTDDEELLTRSGASELGTPPNDAAVCSMARISHASSGACCGVVDGHEEIG